MVFDMRLKMQYHFSDTKDTSSLSQFLTNHVITAANDVKTIRRDHIMAFTQSGGPGPSEFITL